MSGAWGFHAGYLLMLSIAAAAAVPDLRRGLIPNRLLRWSLVVVAALALVIGLSTTSLWSLPAALPAGLPLGEAALAVLENALFGLVVSMTLYGFGLWAAGDAKLAIVLALAQPAWVGVGGPLPWAPFTVVLANTFLAAAAGIVVEALLRRAPGTVRAVVSALAQRRLPFSWAALLEVARISLAMAAMVAALSPIRRLAGEWAAGVFSGGYFFALLVLVIAYKPLRRLVLTRTGLAGVTLVFVASAAYMVVTGGTSGALELGHTLLFSLSVMAVLGLIGAATRPLDTRAIGPSELRPGMVLTEDFLDALEVERRWVEAFASVVGSLRGVKLDDNLIANVREWHAHNAPDSEILVKAHVPFAPAFVAGVLLTALTGRLVFTFS